MLEEIQGLNSITFQFVGIFFPFRFLTNWNSVGFKILMHKYIDIHMYLCMYVNTFFLKQAFLSGMTLSGETFTKSLWRESLLFYIMTPSLGHQEHRVYVTTPCLVSIKISGHKGSLFWFNIFRGC